MTDERKLAYLRAQVDEVEAADDLLSTYLDLAGELILNRLYPYRDESEEDDPLIPQRYHLLQVRIAAVLFAKRGAEGQTTHDENGVKRVYANAEVPDEMLNEIVPFVGVIR